MPRSKPRIVWTDTMRTTLHILHTDFDYNPQQLVDIFGRIFADHLRQLGVSEPIGPRIKAQYNERGKTASWRAVCKTDLSAQEIANRETIKVKIRDAERSLNTPVPKPTAPKRNAPAPERNTPPTTVPRHTPDSQPSLLFTRSLPLSKQTPIALWAPEDPPRPKRRKLIHARQNVTARRHDTARRVVATDTLATPPTTAKKQVLQADKFSFARIHGTALQLSADQVAKTKEHISPVGANEAHPPLPGLFFRYWTKDSTEPSHNSDAGFVARKYFGRVTVQQSPAPCNVLDWTDIFYHIDRIGIEMEFESPYISVSNSLIWILRLALREAIDGHANGMVSVIDPELVGRKRCFYVPPFHRELKKRYQFTSGSWRYQGTHEWVVWKEIPGEAMIKTFKVAELLQLINRCEPVRRTLSPHIFIKRGDLKTIILPQLRQRNVELLPDTVDGLARIAALLGITPSSSTIEQISYSVCEVVQGWALNISHQTQSEWSTLATTFATSLFQHSGQKPTLRDEVKVKRAFLDGISWASSACFNTSHSPVAVGRMLKRARAIGLDDPGKLLSDELAAAQMGLVLFEKRRQRRLPGLHTELLVSNGNGSVAADDDASDSEVQAVGGGDGDDVDDDEGDGADDAEDSVGGFRWPRRANKGKYVRTAVDEEDDAEDSVGGFRWPRRANKDDDLHTTVDGEAIVYEISDDEDPLALA